MDSLFWIRPGDGDRKLRRLEDVYERYWKQMQLLTTYVPEQEWENSFCTEKNPDYQYELYAVIAVNIEGRMAVRDYEISYLPEEAAEIEDWFQEYLTERNMKELAYEFAESQKASDWIILE